MHAFKTMAAKTDLGKYNSKSGIQTISSVTAPTNPAATQHIKDVRTPASSAMGAWVITEAIGYTPYIHFHLFYFFSFLIFFVCQNTKKKHDSHCHKNTKYKAHTKHTHTHTKKK